ncbi:MAG: hypothetical protein ACLVB5_02315 [Christensenellales bacterium]
MLGDDLTCSLALADRLDDIKAAGKLNRWRPARIGRRMSSVIDDDCNIVGTDILMCQWMAEQLGVELEVTADGVFDARARRLSARATWT